MIPTLLADHDGIVFTWFWILVTKIEIVEHEMHLYRWMDGWFPHGRLFPKSIQMEYNADATMPLVLEV